MNFSTGSNASAPAAASNSAKDSQPVKEFPSKIADRSGRQYHAVRLGGIEFAGGFRAAWQRFFAQR